MMSRVGHALRGSELSAALDEMYRASRVVAKYMQNFDILLLPTTSRTASRVGELAPGRAEATLLRALGRAPVGRALVAGLDRLAEASLAATPNTQLFNQTGQPAISLPLAMGKDGLPIGVQLAARMGEEALLLQVAAQLESHRPWASRKPSWL
jgi:amidase